MNKQFFDVKTPQELMEYLNKNFEYGVIDNNGKKLYDSNTNEFQHACNKDWFLRDVKQMLKDKIGHCYDQVEIEREWFIKNGYKIKTFWISAYQKEIENSGFSHTYLIYFDKGYWYIFEHSDCFNRGIHKFKSIKQAVTWQANKQIEFATNTIKPKNKYDVCIIEYTKPPIGLNMDKYLEYIFNYKPYEII